jgi:phospholipid/cholesterol/gamma-HCH transport system permease protein
MSPRPSPEPAGRLSVTRKQEDLVISFSGTLSALTAGPLWRDAFAALERARPARVTVDVTALSYCDGAGIALLAALRRQAGAAIRGLAPAFQSLLDLFPAEEPKPQLPPPREPSLPVQMGRATANVLRDMRRQVTFIGELLATAGRAAFRWRDLRWRDALRTAERAGVDALPIISLIGVLIGLILAFQSAIPLKQFGAEVFVADLVSISVVRELGPLMTSIVLAGRSGSAFAAELGTMKVNEEIDALSTMGLAPVRFLVLPRVAAVVLVMPLLTIYFNLMAMAGAAAVVGSFGYGLRTFVNHAASVVTLESLVGGLVKALAFGLIVGAVGCQRGLATGTGAVAVGASTTRSVVAGILLTILVDGAFAGLFYALDL